MWPGGSRGSRSRRICDLLAHGTRFLLVFFLRNMLGSGHAVCCVFPPCRIDRGELPGAAVRLRLRPAAPGCRNLAASLLRRRDTGHTDRIDRSRMYSSVCMSSSYPHYPMYKIHRNPSFVCPFCGYVLSIVYPLCLYVPRV